MPKVQAQAWECNRCGHQWLPRIKREPKRCPQCKSPYWNKKRVRPVVKRA